MKASIVSGQIFEVMDESVNENGNNVAATAGSGGDNVLSKFEQ
jgi:hypothetical protein